MLAPHGLGPPIPLLLLLLDAHGLCLGPHDSRAALEYPLVQVGRPF